MIFFDSLKVFFYINRIFGLWFYDYDHDGYLISSKLTKFKTSIPLLIYITMIVYSLYSIRHNYTKFYSFKDFASINLVLIYVAVIGNTIITMTITVLNHAKIMQVYNNLYKFDLKLFNGFRMPIDYGEWRQKIIITSSIICGFYGSDLIILTYMRFRNANFIYFLTNNMTMWLSAVNCYQYWLTLNMLEKRFHSLNELIDRTNFNEMKWSKLNGLYYQLCDIIDDMNNGFGLRVFMDNGRDMFFVTYQIFLIYWSNFDRMVIILNAVVGLPFYTKLFVMGAQPNWTINVAELTGQRIRQININFSKIRLSSLKRLHYDLNFTANDFYTVGMKSLFTVY